MLIFILIDILYSQKAVFGFEKDSIGQNHSSSGFHHPVKKSPQGKFPHLTLGITSLKSSISFTNYSTLITENWKYKK